MMKQRIVYCLLALFCLTSCMDELPFENTNLGEGSTDVTFTMSFHPETGVSLGGTRSAKGDAIKDINNLFIIFFDKSGKDTGIHYYIENPKTTLVKRDTLENKLPTTELETVQVEHTCKIPYGVYRVYAVANMGNLAVNEYKDAIAEEASFKNIRFAWKKDNILSNAQMSGYFITGNEYERNEDGTYRRDARDITIDHSVKNLHAWLRRAASKVTVDYDATGLREGVTIYLKSVKLKNIPASCSLVNENTPEGEKIAFQGQEMDDLIFDGDTIIYEERPERESANKYVLAKGHPYIGDYDYLNDGDEKIHEHKKIHDHLSKAMFFYENMQGIGEEGTVTDKRQDVSGKNESISFSGGAECGHPDNENFGKPAGEGWRDGKENGTYVEVDAYYVSNVLGNVGRGPIKYRFMLGKDIITDYNAERNYHYKLTLKFNGNANEVDWHIDYDEEDAPGVYMPDYYVSYLYNQPYTNYETDPDSYWEKCYPIRLAGTTIGDEITVRIIENNWKPSGSAADLASLELYTGAVYTANSPSTAESRQPALNAALARTGVWHGFLSLYRQEGKAEITETDGVSWGRFSAGEYIYWYNRGQRKSNRKDLAPLAQANEINYGEGYRTYKTTLDGNSEVGEKVYVDLENGSYKVVKSIKNGLNETTIYVPLFTRPLVINQKKGFTGSNPYFSFQREAKLRITATINGESKIKESTVNQVRRIINPKGVFRSWDNTAPFKVTLMYRTSEAPGADFVAFPSEGGPWRATIVTGKGWHIKKGNDKVTQVEGSTNSTVSFTVAPNGRLANSTETACALVRVEYHDYHCVHYIHLRQGYAPLSLDDGTTYWHSFNMRYTDSNSSGDTAYETDCELDEGSMFRYGNLTQAIDAINNFYAPDNLYTTAARYGSNRFVLAPVEEDAQKAKYAAWNDITPGTAFSQTEFKVDGVLCRMPKYADFNTLKEATKTKLDVSLGLCYGDESTGNSEDDEVAFYYSWYARKGAPAWLDYKPAQTGKDPKGQGGIRGCFVYNHDNGDVIFLPLSASTSGRRKGRLEQKGPTTGILRYADFDDTFLNSYASQAPYVPLLHNLYQQYGAIYWVSDQIAIPAGTVAAWDINYSTMDFNSIYVGNLHVGLKNREDNTPADDAAFIRLVQDTKPTQAQCDLIDKRVKNYQK